MPNPPKLSTSLIALIFLFFNLSQVEAPDPVAFFEDRVRCGELCKKAHADFRKAVNEKNCVDLLNVVQVPVNPDENDRASQDLQKNPEFGKHKDSKTGEITKWREPISRAIWEFNWEEVHDDLNDEEKLKINDRFSPRNEVYLRAAECQKLLSVRDPNSASLCNVLAGYEMPGSVNPKSDFLGFIAKDEVVGDEGELREGSSTDSGSTKKSSTKSTENSSSENSPEHSPEDIENPESSEESLLQLKVESGRQHCLDIWKAVEEDDCKSYMKSYTELSKIKRHPKIFPFLLIFVDFGSLFLKHGGDFEHWKNMFAKNDEIERLEEVEKKKKAEADKKKEDELLKVQENENWKSKAEELQAELKKSEEENKKIQEEHSYNQRVSDAKLDAAAKMEAGIAKQKAAEKAAETAQADLQAAQAQTTNAESTLIGDGSSELELFARKYSGSVSRNNEKREIEPMDFENFPDSIQNKFSDRPSFFTQLSEKQDFYSERELQDSQSGDKHKNMPGGAPDFQWEDWLKTRMQMLEPDNFDTQATLKYSSKLGQHDLMQTEAEIFRNKYFEHVDDIRKNFYDLKQFVRFSGASVVLYSLKMSLQHMKVLIRAIEEEDDLLPGKFSDVFAKYGGFLDNDADVKSAAKDGLISPFDFVVPKTAGLEELVKEVVEHQFLTSRVHRPHVLLLQNDCDTFTKSNVLLSNLHAEKVIANSHCESKVKNILENKSFNDLGETLRDNCAAMYVEAKVLVKFHDNPLGAKTEGKLKNLKVIQSLEKGWKKDKNGKPLPNNGLVQRELEYNTDDLDFGKEIPFDVKWDKRVKDGLSAFKVTADDIVYEIPDLNRNALLEVRADDEEFVMNADSDDMTTNVYFKRKGVVQVVLPNKPPGYAADAVVAPKVHLAFDDEKEDNDEGFGPFVQKQAPQILGRAEWSEGKSNNEVTEKVVAEKQKRKELKALNLQTSIGQKLAEADQAEAALENNIQNNAATSQTPESALETVSFFQESAIDLKAALNQQIKKRGNNASSENQSQSNGETTSDSTQGTTTPKSQSTKNQSSSESEAKTLKGAVQNLKLHTHENSWGELSQREILWSTAFEDNNGPFILPKAPDLIFENKAVPNDASTTKAKKPDILEDEEENTSSSNGVSNLIQTHYKHHSSKPAKNQPLFRYSAKWRINDLESNKDVFEPFRAQNFLNDENELIPKKIRLIYDNWAKLHLTIMNKPSIIPSVSPLTPTLRMLKSLPDESGMTGNVYENFPDSFDFGTAKREVNLIWDVEEEDKFAKKLWSFQVDDLTDPSNNFLQLAGFSNPEKLELGNGEKIPEVKISYQNKVVLKVTPQKPKDIIASANPGAVKLCAIRGDIQYVSKNKDFINGGNWKAHLIRNSEDPYDPHLWIKFDDDGNSDIPGTTSTSQNPVFYQVIEMVIRKTGEAHDNSILNRLEQEFDANSLGAGHETDLKDLLTPFEEEYDLVTIGFRQLPVPEVEANLKPFGKESEINIIWPLDQGVKTPEYEAHVGIIDNSVKGVL